MKEIAWVEQVKLCVIDFKSGFWLVKLMLSFALPVNGMVVLSRDSIILHFQWVNTTLSSTWMKLQDLRYYLFPLISALACGADFYPGGPGEPGGPGGPMGPSTPSLPRGPAGPLCPRGPLSPVGPFRTDPDCKYWHVARHEVTASSNRVRVSTKLSMSTT